MLKKGILNKLKLINSINKDEYRAIIVHDSKQRSKIISVFLNKKIIISSNIDSNISYYSDIQNILNSLKFSFDKSDLNTLADRSYKELRLQQYTLQSLPRFEVMLAKIENLSKDFILFHFDEKWIHNQYISSYINIEPTENELISFFNSIVNKTNKNLVVTTGLNTPKILDNIFTNKLNTKITFFNNINFLDIESLIDKSELLISCHGALSHVASSKSIKQIDIIEEKKINFYRKWTDHFRNYKSINRKNFNLLANEIINLL